MNVYVWIATEEALDENQHFKDHLKKSGKWSFLIVSVSSNCDDDDSEEFIIYTYSDSHS